MTDASPHELNLPGVETVSCDQEPIDRPGSIQPHGLLLLAEAMSHVVVGGAGDLERRLSPDWLGRSLTDLLGQDIGERLGTAAAGQQDIMLEQVRGLSEMFDVTAHRSDNSVFIELEPAAQSPLSGADVLLGLDAASLTFERAADLTDLLQRAVLAFRQITGFDHVMVYRFLDDDAGVVMAEARDAASVSFLNHHFPASDIPTQARALYIRNRVRVIPDVDYAPAPLRPDPPGGSFIDMSDVALRSVSPIHVQYLKNMKVAASASVSIVKDGVLWGLIACHNQTPRHLPFDIRMMCRTLAGGLARQIRAKDEAEHYREQIRLRSAEDAVLARLSRDPSLDTVFADGGEDLRTMMGADGFAAVHGRTLVEVGHCPERSLLRELAGWVKGRTTTHPFHSHSLSETCDLARECQDVASGLLAVTTSADLPVILLWFRAEEIEVVEWAGNPHKAVASDPGAVLTPRTSFEAWREEVRGRSRAWTLAELEAASRLKRYIVEAQQNQRVRNLNRDLTATIADKDNLLVQKDYLIKEVNHRVQNSLQLVSAFLSLQARAVGDPALTNHLEEAKRRLSAVALVHRRLYGDDRIDSIDLARYLDDLCKELKTSMGADWGQSIGVDLAPILMSADRAVDVGLILTELVINANKYAYDGASGPVLISLEQHRARFRLIVADRGSGKRSARQGFGTRMVSAMVDKLGGVIEETDNAPGLRVIVSAPVDRKA